MVTQSAAPVAWTETPVAQVTASKHRATVAGLTVSIEPYVAGSDRFVVSASGHVGTDFVFAQAAEHLDDLDAAKALGIALAERLAALGVTA